MRVSFRRAVVLAVTLGLASAALITFHETPTAEARGFSFRRAFRSVARVFRRVAAPIARVVRRVTAPIARVVRRVVTVVRRVAAPVIRVVRRVATVVRRVATTVTRAVGTVVKKVGTVVKKVGAVVGKALKTVVKVAGQVWKTVTDVVKGLAGCIKKLNFGCVWDLLKEKLFGPIKEWFQKLKDKAKAAIQKLIDKAKKALSGIFMDKVIQPALKWAMEKILGSSIGQKIKSFVERILGKAEAIAARGEQFAAVVQALAEKNLGKYKDAMAKFETGLNSWTNITLADIADRLIDYAKERLLEFIRGKVVELLDKGYSLVETPIEAGKTAAVNAIRAIPFVGGVLGGAVDVLITAGLKLLREMGFKFVADKAAELAGKLIDKVKPYIVRGAAQLDTKLKPIIDKVKPYVQKALEFVSGVKDKWNMLRDKLRKAGEILARAHAAVK